MHAVPGGMACSTVDWLFELWNLVGDAFQMHSARTLNKNNVTGGQDPLEMTGHALYLIELQRLICGDSSVPRRRHSVPAQGASSKKQINPHHLGCECAD